MIYYILVGAICLPCGFFLHKIVTYIRSSGSMFISLSNPEDIKARLSLLDDLDVIAKRKIIYLFIDTNEKNNPFNEI